MKMRSANPREIAQAPALRLAPGLAAIAFLAALGFGPSDVVAQQTQGTVPEQAAPQPQGSPQEGTGSPGVAVTERQFKDWVVRCGRPNEQAPELCEMQQLVDSEDRTVMAVAVARVPGTTDLGLLIVLPLGIVLPAGVALQIDGGAEIPLQVDRCERQGCRIEMLLEPDLVNRLKAGSRATVFFEAPDPQGERQRLAVPISLLGFTAALNEVTS